MEGREDIQVDRARSNTDGKDGSGSIFLYPFGFATHHGDHRRIDRKIWDGVE